MDRDFLKGFKISLGFIFGFALLGLVYAVGFHIAEEILPGTFTGDFEFNGSVNFTNANVEGAGSVVGFDYRYNNNLVTSTGIIPGDTTIPQITEGSSILKINYTPRKNNSIILLETSLQFFGANSNTIIISLFSNESTNALATRSWSPPGDTYANLVTFDAIINTTSILTKEFQVRVGTTGGSNVYVGGYSSTDLYGSSDGTYLSVTEIVR